MGSDSESDEFDEYEQYEEESQSASSTRSEDSRVGSLSLFLCALCALCSSLDESRDSQSEASELGQRSVGGSSVSRALPALSAGPTVTARVRHGPMNPGVLLKVAQWILGSGGRVCDFSDKLHFPYTAVIIFLFVTVRTLEFMLVHELLLLTCAQSGVQTCLLALCSVAQAVRVQGTGTGTSW